LAVIANSSAIAGAGTLSWKLQKNLGFGLRAKLSAELKKHENRRALRRGHFENAWIRSEGSFGLQPCQVVDLSRTGVRLRIANLQNVPSKFILMLSKFGTGHLARVKWRRGSQVGAELLSAASSGDTNSGNHAAEPSIGGGGKSHRDRQ
jgi:hypothetical protein